MSQTLPPVANPEIELSISYAAPPRRGALRALWTLDAQLAATLVRAADPMVARLRLTWWREALIRLDAAPPPPQPLLATLAAVVLPAGIAGHELAVLTDGWEALLVPDPLSIDDLEAYASGRGQLFVLGGRVLGAGGFPIAAAGQGWALVDLAGHVRSAEAAAMARALAGPLVRGAFAQRWPRAVRPFGAMVALAARDLHGPKEPRGAPRRVWRMLRHRVTGR